MSKTLLQQYLKGVNPEELSKQYRTRPTRDVEQAYQDYYGVDADKVGIELEEDSGPKVVSDITGSTKKYPDDFINTLLGTGLFSGGPLIKGISGLGLGYNMGANYFGLPTLGQMPDAAYKFGGSLYNPYGSYNEMFQAHRAQEKAKKESTVVGTGTSNTGKAY